MCYGFILIPFYYVKSGFFIFIHYLTLIANVEMSKVTCRYETWRVMDNFFYGVVYFLLFSMVLT
jgi:hypothetical protein